MDLKKSYKQQEKEKTRIKSTLKMKTTKLNSIKELKFKEKSKILLGKSLIKNSLKEIKSKTYIKTKLKQSNLSKITDTKFSRIMSEPSLRYKNSPVKMNQKKWPGSKLSKSQSATKSCKSLSKTKTVKPIKLEPISLKTKNDTSVVDVKCSKKIKLSEKTISTKKDSSKLIQIKQQIAPDNNEKDRNEKSK